MIRLLLDADVLVDAFAVKREGHAAARAVFELAHAGEVECLVCAISLEPVFREVALLADEAVAWDYLRAIVGMFEVVDAASAMCRQAIGAAEDGQRPGLGFGSALLEAVARSTRADFIVTSAPPPPAARSSRTLTPDALTALLGQLGPVQVP